MAAETDCHANSTLRSGAIAQRARLPPMSSAHPAHVTVRETRRPNAIARHALVDISCHPSTGTANSVHDVRARGLLKVRARWNQSGRQHHSATIDLDDSFPGQKLLIDRT